MLMFTVMVRLQDGGGILWNQRLIYVLPKFTEIISDKIDLVVTELHYGFPLYFAQDVLWLEFVHTDRRIIPCD